MAKIDALLGLDGPRQLVIRPAVWWLIHEDGLSRESRLAAWAKGRDFQIVGGPYVSRNETIGRTDVVFVDSMLGFTYPNYPEGAEKVYYTAPRKHSDESSEGP